eukprot:NODE_386_length_9538_cov_0.348766.p4 type:complete len:227 gc:universal NODE_386_length_9538_cov_0.348766:6187-5507(-)
MFILQLTCICSIASDTASDISRVASVSSNINYDEISFKSIAKSIKTGYSDAKRIVREVASKPREIWNKIPKLKTVAAIGGAAVVSIIIAAARDVMHDKLMYVYSVKCESSISVAQNCILKTFVNGIDSTFGLKRLTIYLVTSAGKKYNLEDCQLRKYLSYAVRSETYPYIGFGEIEVPFIMPTVPEGEYKIQAIVHWWPFEWLLAVEDISNGFQVSGKTIKTKANK